MKQKAMTLRLDPNLAAELERVAEVDEVSTSDAVREAISAHVEQRRKDKEFQKRLRRLMDSNAEILARLAR